MSSKTILRKPGRILLFLLLIPFFVFAKNDPFEIKIQPLLLSDCNKLFSIEDVKNQPFGEFESVSKNLNSDCFFWEKFTFKNATKCEDWMLRFPDNIAEADIFFEKTRFAE